MSEQGFDSDNTVTKLDQRGMEVDDYSKDEYVGASST